VSDTWDGSATPERGRPKGERTPLTARLGLFYRQVVAELHKVIWPTRRELITYTTVSLVFVLFMVAIVSGIDYGLQKGVYELFG
jgi:preprotein translocase subunit SecE